MPLNDLATAFMLLTRLPAARFAGETPNAARAVWAFPLVGLVVGALGGVIYALMHWLGVAPLVGAAWALAVTSVVTGAMHDDGLADTADGFGGGASAERKLEIMRDSRIGGFGALALLLSVVVRVAAIAALDDALRVTAGMIAAAMLGRGAMLGLVLMLRPARDDGMGVSMRQASRQRVALGLGLATAGAVLFQPAALAVVAVALAAGVTLAMAKLARSQIGGYTGDVLGGVEVVCECVVLTATSSILKP